MLGALCSGITPTLSQVGATARGRKTAIDVGERLAKLMSALGETPTSLDPEPDAEAET